MLNKYLIVKYIKYGNGFHIKHIPKKVKIYGKEYEILNKDDTDMPLEIAYISKANAHKEHSEMVTARARFIFIVRC